MGWFAATLGVIILSGFINLSVAIKDTCDLYAAVGQNLILPFQYERLTNAHGLKWTHNNSIVFSREKGKLSIGKTEDISPVGSLLLKNLQFSGAGIYQANVLYPNGTSAIKWSSQLCVTDKVSKPQVTYVCDCKSSIVNLNCNVTNPQGLVFSWTLDKKTLPSENRQTLNMPLALLKGETSFTCNVENKGSKEKSDAVHPACKGLNFFTPKSVMAVLAGGGGLILLLLIIIIILCCRLKRSKTQMRLRNKVELRMPSLNKQESGSVSPDYETMHAAEDYPRVSPKPSPRACYQNVSQPEGQTENKPVQLSPAAEGQQPSPVPKPRTKNLQTANI